MTESRRVPRYMTEGSDLFLRPFCSTATTRYELDYPFRQGDATYASDGTIAVKITDIAWDCAEGGRVTAPQMQKIGFPTQKTGWRKPDELCVLPSDWGQCPLCEEGRIGPWGVAGYAAGCPGCCEAVDDEGEELPHSKCCVPCPACEGNGLAGYAYTLDGNLQELNPKLIVRMLSLPDVELRWGSKATEKFIVPLLFRFPGGSGVLMPIGKA